MLVSDMDGMGEFCGCMVGFIGYGSVGKIIGKFCDVFGVDVIYIVRSVKDEVFVWWCVLDDLVSQVDIVCFCFFLIFEIEWLLDKDRFVVMKQGVILINIFCGGLVDE